MIENRASIRSRSSCAGVRAIWMFGPRAWSIFFCAAGKKTYTATPIDLSSMWANFSDMPKIFEHKQQG